MNYKYHCTTKEDDFETNCQSEIPWDKLHSLNDDPSFENLITGYKSWHCNGSTHRLYGPARIWNNGQTEFWLNSKKFEFKDWCENHPDKTILVMYLLKS